MTRRNVSLASAVTLCVLLGGCHHSPATVQRAAPAAPPAVGPVMVSVPPPTHHDQPEIVPVTAPVQPPVRETTHRPAKSQRRSSASSTPSAGTATPIAPAQTSATAPIPLGELSAGGEVSAGLRQQTNDLLRSQQQRLDTLGRAGQAAHATEIAQARGFLQRANTSWAAADYEGAHTMAVKAKVLLDDIDKE